MAGFQRSTRECAIDGLRPELSAALWEYVARRGLEDEISSALMCCETVSTREKRRLFRRTEEVSLQAVVLTPKWLIWASGKEGKPPGAFATPLHEIRVEDYEKSSTYQLQEDRGVNIYGLKTAEGTGSAFIGLGPEPAARRFRNMLQESIANA